MGHYTSQMINARVQQGIGAVILLGAVYMGILGTKGSEIFIPLAFGLVFGAGLIWQGSSIASRVERYTSHTYERYAKDYPAYVTANGVTCFQCKSPKVHTKNLMRGSFTREHHCGQCGTTLYYSPERNR